MDDSRSPEVSRSAPEQRFDLAVWPQTPASPWHAEVCVPGEALPRRFERPMDLLLYLTELSDNLPPHQQRGLR
jgi:hypothetical protein